MKYLKRKDEEIFALTQQSLDFRREYEKAGKEILKIDDRISEQSSVKTSVAHHNCVRALKQSQGR